MRATLRCDGLRLAATVPAPGHFAHHGHSQHARSLCMCRRRTGRPSAATAAHCRCFLLPRHAHLSGRRTPGSAAPQRAAATAAAGHRGCCATSEPGYRPAATPPMRSQAMQAALSCVHTRSDSASSQGTFVHEKRNSDSWKDIAFSIVGG